MTIHDVVESLCSFDDDQTIYVDASGKLDSRTQAVVVWAPEDDTEPPDAKGMKCFLDVWHAKDVIEKKAQLSGLHMPALDDKIRLLIEYARTGA